MRSAFKRLFLVIVILSTIVLGVSQSSVQASSAENAPVPAPAPTEEPGDIKEEGVEETGTDATSSIVCSFRIEGDYVHISSSAFEASGHGWWINGNCNTTFAVVTVQLQQYYSDGSWRNVGTVGTATVRSGGGAGNRATGRAVCNNNSVTGWRSVIDVDLVGILDSPRKYTTATRNIACRHG
jgi:hypothetical protein